MTEIEYQARLENARKGETIDQYRDMAGMAPYIINGGFQYSPKSDTKFEGLELGVYYNVQGPSLQYVGVADKPDIYSVPFHSLNFNSSYKFGKDKKFTAGFKVSNILNSIKESVYESYNASDQYFSRLHLGRTFSFKLSYQIY